MVDSQPEACDDLLRMADTVNSSSHLLRIPTEIRIEIYATYFSSLTLFYPYTRHEATHLLLACRKIYTEALPLLLENALYAFHADDSLYDVLSYFPTLPTSTISSLRYLSIAHGIIGTLNDVYHPDRSYDYSIATVLPFLTGLQLHTLRMTDSHCRQGCRQGHYHIVTRLIESDGFKECVYTTNSDRWLKDVASSILRDPQPLTWDRAINERDGETSGPNVRLFFTRRNKERIELKGDYDTKHRYEPPEGEFGPPKRMGIEVHIRRGKGVKYRQTGATALNAEKLPKPRTWESSRRCTPVGDLQEYMRRFRAIRPAEDWQFHNWQLAADGREICRSLLPNPIQYDDAGIDTDK